MIPFVRLPTLPASVPALFNGKDLAGWRGGSTYDHRQLFERSVTERDTPIAKL